MENTEKAPKAESAARRALTALIAIRPLPGPRNAAVRGMIGRERAKALGETRALLAHDAIGGTKPRQSA